MFTNALFTAAVACGLLASSVNAHMVIRAPIPYGQDSLNNSPLEADGSDFPCKQRSGVYDVTKMNSMPVGVPQELAFKGGATHGGGSCQVSISTDTQPTKNSKWKVIKSIIGGCPSNATANLSGNPDGTDSSVFEFSIPQGVPNGKYALAWTWFNKIGNREMYMNCAPIEVTGGSSKRDTSALDDLPDMFVANIGNGCTVAESQDFVFPVCGKYAETVERTALGSSTSGTCATGAAGSGSGSGSSQATPTASSGSDASAPAYGSSSAAAAPTGYGGSSGAAPTTASAPPYGGAATSAAGAPAYSSPAEQGSGSDASESGSGDSGMVTLTTMQTVTGTGGSPAAAQATGYSNSSTSGSDSSSGAAAAGSNSSSAATSGSCSGGAQACSDDGAVVCIGSNQWGLCNAGCAVPESLASGTTCSNGVIAKRDDASHLKRHLHYGHKA